MYTELFELHAELLKALAHPRRLEIVQLIRDQELPVSDIHTMLDLPQANISQHLMILRDASVVQTRRDGKHIYYALAHPHFSAACDLIREILIEKHQHSPLARQFDVAMMDLVPLVHDPVCGMRISPKTAGFHHTHQGQTYFFCASGCLKAFMAHPEKHL